MQDIFKQLSDEGQLVEQTMEQLYSEAAGKFLADRLVSGRCPKCSYEVRCVHNQPALLPACNPSHTLVRYCQQPI